MEITLEGEQEEDMGLTVDAPRQAHNLLVARGEAISMEEVGFDSKIHLKGIMRNIKAIHISRQVLHRCPAEGT